MRTTLYKTRITQEMLDATGDCIEQAVAYSDIQDLVFIQVLGGLWTIYNSQLKQTLKRRWNGVDIARGWAISAICDKQ